MTTKKNASGFGGHRKFHLLRLAVLVVVTMPAVKFLFWEVSYETEHGGVFSPLMMFDWALQWFWLVLLVSSPVWAAMRWKTIGWACVLPIAVLLLPILSIGLATTFWLEYNYRKYADERSKLFDQIQVTEHLSTTSSWPADALASELQAQLSIDRKVRIKRTPTGTLVLFATWFGLPDGFSGFVYAPDGADPASGWQELRLDWSDRWREDDNVYFVGNF